MYWSATRPFFITRTLQKMTALDKRDAYHEAGHATVALAHAEAMGYPPHRAAVITVPKPEDRQRSVVDSVTLYRHASCTTPRLSQPMDDFGFLPCPKSAREFSGMWRICAAAARTEGIDVDTWARAKCAIYVGGIVAEARFADETVASVMQYVGVRNDLEAARDVVRVAGLDYGAELERAVAEVRQLFDWRPAWATVEDIAAEVRETGDVSGWRVAEIARWHGMI
jgi:hypothetical protein